MFDTRISESAQTRARALKYTHRMEAIMQLIIYLSCKMLKTSLNRWTKIHFDLSQLYSSFSLIYNNIHECAIFFFLFSFCWVSLVLLRHLNIIYICKCVCVSVFMSVRAKNPQLVNHFECMWQNVKLENAPHWKWFQQNFVEVFLFRVLFLGCVLPLYMCVCVCMVSFIRLFFVHFWNDFDRWKLL